MSGWIQDGFFNIPLWVWLTLPIWLGVFVFSQAGACLLLRVPFKRIQLGLGPPLWMTRLGDVELGVHALPIGGTLSFPSEEGVWGIPPGKRALILLAGPTDLFVAAWVFGWVWPELELLLNGLAIINLLPLSTTAGGMLILTALEALTGRRPPARLILGYGVASAFVMFALLVWVIVTLVSA